MRFLIHRDVKAGAPQALAWVRDFLGQFDTSGVAWLRIDLGREYRDKRGRLYRKYRGVYGRCWYPSVKQPKVRISCQVPGPFPCDILTRQSPVYRNADKSWPTAAKQLRGPVIKDVRSGRQWKRVYGRTEVRSLDEAIIWIVAHECFHWLRKTRQIPGRNNEVEADAFADRKLSEFRKSLPSPATLRGGHEAFVVPASAGLEASLPPQGGTTNSRVPRNGATRSDGEKERVPNGVQGELFDWPFVKPPA